MNPWLPLLQKALPSLDEASLYLPLQDAGIDSIDQVLLRALLEKELGLVLSDSQWYRFATLAEALAYCGAGGGWAKELQAPEPLRLQQTHEIRMPQMANAALSESWLLQTLGDAHWRLMEQGLGKPSAQIQDGEGQRLYATFVRIRYHLAPLYRYTENESFVLEGGLTRYGGGTCISRFAGGAPLRPLEACLLTTCSRRYGGDNTLMEKGEPAAISAIPEEPAMPPLLQEYRLVHKGFCHAIGSPYGKLQLGAASLFTTTCQPNPWRDINGVGLLYFAAYPLLADTGLLPHFASDPRYLRSHTCWRDLLYFANCNPSDTIEIQLNWLEWQGPRLLTAVSLWRKKDGVLMAWVLTVRELLDG